MTKEGCIINPATGRAVKTTTRLGKKLMAQAQQLDDEYKGGKVLKAAAKRAAVQKEAVAKNKAGGVLAAAAKRAAVQKEAVAKNKAGGVLAAAAKRAMTKKPEPTKPDKKFGFEDLPGDVKDIITGVVKKNKNRKDMIKDAKEKLKGYKLPGYTKMSNEELYDWVYGGKLDKAVAELDKKNAEKQEEKNKNWVRNHILTLFRMGENRYRDSKELSIFEMIVRKHSINPTAGLYDGKFEDGIRTDVGDGERFIRWYRKDLSSNGTGGLPFVVAFKDYKSHVTFLTLDTIAGTVDKNAIIKKWRIYAKPGSPLRNQLDRIKELPSEYDDMDNFLERSHFVVNDGNVKYR